MYPMLYFILCILKFKNTKCISYQLLLVTYTCNDILTLYYLSHSPGVTILLSLTVFLLLVAETMPPTSDAVPLIGEGVQERCCPIKNTQL